MKRLAILFLTALLVLPGLAQAKIFLVDTDDTLRVVTAGGVSTIHMYAAWADLTTTALTPGASDAQVTTATTTTLVAAPGASTQRQIKGLSIRNSHASSSNVITVQFYDGATATELIQYTLLAGETLQWGEDENFRVIDASGQVKGVVAANPGTQANWGIYAEDTAHSSGDNLQLAGVVRSDAAAALAADGDRTVLQVDANGYLKVVNINPNLAADNSTLSTAKVPVLPGTVSTSAPTWTNGNQSALSLQTDGSVRAAVTNTVTVTASNLDVQIGGSDSLTIGTFPDNEPFNVAQMNGVAVSMGVGASGTGTQRVASLIHDGTDTAQVTATAGGSLQVECTSGCSGSGGTSIADDAAFTPGTTSVTPVGAMFDDVTPDSVNEGDAGVLRMSANRNLYSTIRDAAGNERGANVNASNELLVNAGSVTIGTFPDNEPFNVAQINGVTPLMGAGNTGTGSLRVTVATDQAALNGLGVYVEDAGETAGGNLSMAGSVRRDTAASSAGASGDNATVNTDANGLLWTRQLDPCTALSKSYVNINQTTGTQLFTGTASTRTFVCGISLVTATAQNVALVSGTGTVCATGTAGLMGGTTAGTGWNFAANSGIVIGTGVGTVTKTGTDAHNVCLLQSSTGQISGVISYVTAANQ